MKKFFVSIITLFAAFLTSCSIQESETAIKTNAEEPEFYASIEDASTRVFVDENLSVLWNADDRVSIFNKNTYNQQYKFLGETGDNAGGFNKVDVAEFVTGKPITNVISVYPYQEDTKISEDGVLTVTLPAEQTYSENTFGIGTNMMVSVSSDNFLQYKNVGGYLRLKLYGEGVAISTIILTGNNGEKLAGKAIITLSSDGTPSVQMANNANTGVSLNCNRSVLLGSSSEKSTEFWFVLPPVTFSKGFTITVKKKNGQTFTKKTSNPVTITRNNLLNMVPFEVEMEGTQPNNVIYYTSKDSTIVNPTTVRGFGASYVSNNYIDGVGIITFNGAVESIPNNAFKQCVSLTSIILPESVEGISTSAFYGCSNLSYVKFPENLTVLGQYAFYGCSTIPSLDLPEYLYNIGQATFQGCTSLTSIRLPNTIEGNIEKNAFFGCSKLTTIALPNNLKNIGEDAFYGCTSLVSVTFPDKMNGGIGQGAFYGCSKLASIKLPDNLESIGQSAFKGCTSLVSVTFPDKMNGGIGQSAFYGCSKLTSIIFPDNLESIGEAAFRGCSNLNNVDLPQSISSIGIEAFAECRSLESINLPKGLDLISQNVFSGCNSLISIKIPKSVMQINAGAFDGCSSLKEITIPDSVTCINSSTFHNCSSLTSIIIPESVTNIGIWAFRDCSKLTKIIIPSGITSIGQEAFRNCSSLERIDVRATTPPEGAKDMFTNTALCPIYIPSGSEDAYLNAEYWKHYALRLRTENSNSSIAYCSSDFSKDGEVVQLQQASVGRGINIIFLGDGFLDRDMTPGGKYEVKMREAMEQFFAYEPYYSFRKRFNIYAVRVVSENDIYFNELSRRALSYEHGDTISYRRAKCFDYASIVPNPYNQPLKIGIVFNSDATIGRSFCTMNLVDGHCCAFVLGINDNIINHELGGHGFAFLDDEYVEKEKYFSEQSLLDDRFIQYGFGANVDWRSDPNEVRWARLLKDPRYAYEGLGVYEGGGLYAHGIYRATENSMMRYNDTPFNAPSREQIYKMIMKYSEGEDWVYDYEEFVKADERGRMEAAEELGPWKSPRRKTRSQIQAESQHHPPVLIDDSVKEIGMDKDGNVILVR